jgi:hypothetical protein
MAKKLAGEVTMGKIPELLGGQFAGSPPISYPSQSTSW